MLVKPNLNTTAMNKVERMFSKTPHRQRQPEYKFWCISFQNFLYVYTLFLNKVTRMHVVTFLLEVQLTYDVIFLGL